MSEQELQPKQVNPWDQQPGEPSEAYARFLVYRNLGPGRTIEAAYGASSLKSRKSQATSGQWFSDSASHGWRERAHQWDIEQLTQAGQRTVTAFVSALELACQRLLARMIEDKLEPKTWKEVVDALNTLGNFIPAETVAQIRATADRHEVAAIGKTSGDGE